MLLKPDATNSSQSLQKGWRQRESRHLAWPTTMTVVTSRWRTSVEVTINIHSNITSLHPHHLPHPSLAFCKFLITFHSVDHAKSATAHGRPMAALHPHCPTVNIVLEITRIVQSGAFTRRDSIVFGKGEILPEDPVLTFYATYTPGSAPFFLCVAAVDNRVSKREFTICRQNDFYSFGYLVLD